MITDQDSSEEKTDDQTENETGSNTEDSTVNSGISHRKAVLKRRRQQWYASRVLIRRR